MRPRQHFATRLLHSQYNQSILRDIRMWVSKISQPEQTIKIADFGFTVQVNTNSLHTDMHVGYDRQGKTSWNQKMKMAPRLRMVLKERFVHWKSREQGRNLSVNLTRTQILVHRGTRFALRRQ